MLTYGVKWLDQNVCIQDVCVFVSADIFDIRIQMRKYYNDYSMSTQFFFSASLRRNISPDLSLNKRRVEDFDWNLSQNHSISMPNLLENQML